MRSIMISIKPKRCELIASGKKTMEVRKTKPKLETPFKVYIYCTSNKQGAKDLLEIHGTDGKFRKANDKVIGEFVCDHIDRIDVIDNPLMTYIKVNDKASMTITDDTCLNIDELLKYSDGKTLFGWHISDLVIYEKPKELSEFYKECEEPECDDCPYLCFENTQNSYEGWCKFDEKIPITRPPQNWLYVEELD